MKTESYVGVLCKIEENSFSHHHHSGSVIISSHDCFNCVAYIAGLLNMLHILKLDINLRRGL